MQLPQLLLVLFMVFFDNVSALSWLQNPYLWNITTFEKQSPSNSSLLLTETSAESMIEHVSKEFGNLIAVFGYFICFSCCVIYLWTCVNFSQYACYDSNTFPESVLTGGMGSFDVYSFTNLKNKQISASALWVTNQRPDDYSSINAAIAGWEVSYFLFIISIGMLNFMHPNLLLFISSTFFSVVSNLLQVNPFRHGDSKTYFFTEWTVSSLQHVWLSKMIRLIMFSCSPSVP
jgi:hypothetical protein